MIRTSRALADPHDCPAKLTFKTGQGVSIAGIRGEVVEELADGRYKVQGETGDQRGKGYSHTSEWILDGWRLTLAP